MTVVGRLSEYGRFLVARWGYELESENANHD